MAWRKGYIMIVYFYFFSNGSSSIVFLAVLAFREGGKLFRVMPAVVLLPGATAVPDAPDVHGPHVPGATVAWYFIKESKVHL